MVLGNPPTGHVWRPYYYDGNTRIAVRAGSNAPSWLLTDHLGSTSKAADYNGALTSTALYKPWGSTRYTSGTLPTKYTYTGQYSYTADFGLMYYGARWYDSALGRWTQPDTVIPEASQGTQAWDRMAYVNNNAVNYTDPSGSTAYSDDGICIGNCAPSEPQLDLNDVKDPEGRNKPIPEEEDIYPDGYIKPAWENYQKIWWWLMYHGFSWAIDPHTGKIRDYVVMAFIIFGEFSTLNRNKVDEYGNSSMAAYNAALGALSNQYHRAYGEHGNKSNIQCASGAPGCTLAEQIGWLSDVPSWYKGNDYSKLADGTANWQYYLEDARKAVNGIDSNMWMWGNTTAPRSDGVNYYAPDVFLNAPWFVVHP